MKRISKKIFSIVIGLLMVCILSLTLFSCGDEEKEQPTEPSVQEVFDGLTMSDKTFEYDGQPHSILLEGTVPEGAQVEYKNNDKVDPGKYNVKAKITYKDRSITKSAFMTITYKKSVLSAEDNQVGYVNSSESIFPSYTLNNDEQEVEAIVKRDGAFVDDIAINRPGTYELELYAPQSTIYAESNHVKIKFTVKQSQFDVTFDSKTMQVDGSEKSIELTGSLPAGYTVEYTNNSGSAVGKYFAVATIKDSTGKEVEVHRAVLTLNNPNDAAFETYLDNFFVEYLEGDQLSVNIFCENPSDFGLERYEAKWYTYTGSTGDYAETVDSFDQMIQELHGYQKDSLSDRQQIAYEQIEDFLTYQKNFYSIQNVEFMKNYYVDQFGGYVADFGTYMEAYSLRGKEDVQDIIDFVNSTKTAFPSYLKYLEDKVNAGYPLSDYTLTEMSKYLGDVLSSMDNNKNYYLEDVLVSKISGLEFLSDAEKKSFTDALAVSFDECFKVGVQELKDGLLKFVGALSKDKEGYWASYGEAGKQLYALELNDLLGLDNFKMDSYISELEDAYADANSKLAKAQDYLFSNYPVNNSFDLERLTQKTEIFAGTPEEKLEFLKEFAKSVVPTLEHTPEITIKEMDNASAKVSNAVAYYMKSALDNDKAEFITLNPLKVGSGNDVIGTLAHEGYPGHLYAYIFTKQMDLHNVTRIMTSTAHGEGWATYVELKLYEYIMDTSKDQTLVDVCNYLYYDHLSTFLLETLLDVYIHYSGYSVSDVEEYLDDHGFNGGAAQNIYNLIIETPTSYAAYGYGKLFFYNLHQEAKLKLGRYYDEVELNAVLLSKGWTSLGKLQQTFDAYIQDVCHQYDIRKK